MATDVISGSNNNNKSSSMSSRHHMLKKGPWTSTEDAALMEYVRIHGEGNWNAVQRNSGLMRCGKSCRLRWANHLRPNLKKGSFSTEEEDLIIDLHAKIGNKWARMAAQLPGRTDNEIKNYWNTRLKRRQRAGLPIYPNDINSQSQSHLKESLQTNISSSSLMSMLSSQPHTQNPGYTTANLGLFEPINRTLQQHPKCSYSNNYNQCYGLIQENNSGHVQPSFPLFSASSTINKHGQLPSLLPIGSIQYNRFNLGSQNAVVSSTATELPSIQSFFHSTTPTSSETAAASDYGITNRDFCRGNSGMLEDLLGESQAKIRAEKPKENKPEIDNINQGKYLWDYKLMEDSVTATATASASEQSFLSYGQDNFAHQKHSQESSPAHSSLGKLTANAASSDQINIADDYLSCLVDNFPLNAPVPDWYHTSRG